MITIFINSFILGKSAKHRGYQEGIRYGFIITIFFIIIALVGKQWKSNLIILYSMIFLTSIL